MNGFGIDLGERLVAICVHEGEAGSGALGSVGDGRRRLVPRATFAAPAAEPDGNHERGAEEPPAATTPDRHEAAAGQPALWTHLHRRLCDFLGGIAPDPENGYQIAVAPSPAADPAAVAAAARAGGLSHVVLVPATDALLCRWLAAELGDPGVLAEPIERIVAVVAAGDASTSVAAYRVTIAATAIAARAVARETTGRLDPGRSEARGWTPALVVKAPGRIEAIPVGLLHLTDRLLEALRGRLTELVAGRDDELLAATIEFGARLRDVPAGRAIAWSGPLRDRLHTPLRLSRRECAAWPEAVALARSLPARLAEALAGLGRDAADVVVVGGMGAAWPYFADAVPGRTWLSAVPEEDVAAGAALWPQLRAAFSGAPTPQVSAPRAPRLASVAGGQARTGSIPEGGQVAPVQEQPAPAPPAERPHQTAVPPVRPPWERSPFAQAGPPPGPAAPARGQPTTGKAGRLDPRGSGVPAGDDQPTG